jgi:riboflavin biosynthesis pyrimidine reductase
MYSTYIHIECVCDDNDQYLHILLSEQVGSLKVEGGEILALIFHKIVEMWQI